jgi:hypothetical protein
MFTDKKIINSRPLNLMGLQVLRALGARLAHRSRRIDVVPDVEDEVQQLEREGVVVWPDFLPADDFEELRNECLGLAGPHPASYVRMSGPNRDARVLVRSLDLDRLPALARFLDCTHLRALLEGAERRRLGDLVQYAKIEHLTQGENIGRQDPQTELHSDIYFTSHKAWFYLTNVTAASGPLTFVKGTHLLTPGRLYRVYEHSVTMKPGDDPSRRLKSREIASLPEASVVICPANTLVVANTCGYHARRQGVPGEERCSIHLEVRAKKPFGLSNGRRSS